MRSCAALMKSTAILVNVARAEIADEDALYEALARKSIAGAALDVWYRYPTGTGPTFPGRRPFHELPNVLLTPHVAGWTEGTLDARARLIADNVGRTARGEPPLNLIPPPRRSSRPPSRPRGAGRPTPCSASPIPPPRPS